MRFLRPRTVLFVMGLLSALLTTPAVAQTQPADEGIHSNIAFGLRGGYTDWDGINQLHLGAHLKLGEVLPNVQFTPNVEAGFGDNVSVITVNADLAYSFTEFVSHPWNLYGGGSLGFNYVNPEGGSSGTDLGVSALFGLERALANGHQVLVEIRLGLVDSPDFKLTFGYTLF